MEIEQFAQFALDVYDERFFRIHTESNFSWEEDASKSLINSLKLESILDLGCGVGRWIKAANDKGITDVYGIEYCHDRAKKYIYESILEKTCKGDVSIELNLSRKFDCVISVEVAEHILPQNSEIFVKNCINHSNRFIVVTAAPPGQGGHGHINCQPLSFWIELFEKNGAKRDIETENQVLELWKNITPEYITRNLIIFKV